MKFRSDINFLRAVAVVLVVLFHMEFAWLPGGFIGVDVFFVISGFLMTGILVPADGKPRGPFLLQLGNFYLARTRRIVPALLVLCLVFMVIGYFLIDPVAYESQSKNITASLLFYSNAYYYSKAGYFAPDAGANVFLHTWSLSVEWQFYLLYPLAIGIIQRFFPKQLVALLCGGVFLSLLASAIVTYAAPSAAFYLLPTRAWEMLLGGVVVFLPAFRSQLVRSVEVFAGLAVILGSSMLMDSLLYWPALWAAIPVFATGAVIHGARPGIWSDNRLASLLGQWSYSIYLWHWPVIVLWRYFGFPADAVATGTEIAIILALSAASFYLVESPARKLFVRRGPARRGTEAVAVLGFVATLASAIMVSANQGLPSRQPDHVANFTANRVAAKDWAYPTSCEFATRLFREPKLNSCFAGDRQAARQVLIFGDSFVQQLYPRYFINPLPGNLGITIISSGGCPPMPASNRLTPGFKCDVLFDMIREYVRSHRIDTLVIGSIWVPYFQLNHDASSIFSQLCFKDKGGSCNLAQDLTTRRDQFDAAFDEFGKFVRESADRGTRVIVLLPTPYAKWNIPNELSKRVFFNRPLDELQRLDIKDFLGYSNVVRSQLGRVTVKNGGVLLDPLESLCPEGVCRLVAKSGEPLYTDRAHLRSSFMKSAPFDELDRIIFGAASP